MKVLSSFLDAMAHLNHSDQQARFDHFLELAKDELSDAQMIEILPSFVRATRILPPANRAGTLNRLLELLIKGQFKKTAPFG